ncbi:MAG: hypothetical protein HY744_33810 [Deltaproteobacteria bacterium]|nr:hypothetical protein [Deltaproteobacteria bacterium]
MRWVAFVAAAVAWAAGVAPARAEEGAAARARRSRRDSPHTVFELGAGLLALPGAKLCPRSPADCEPGETSIALRLQNFYKLGDSFAVGAGITWAFGLRRDTAAGEASLERDHSRSYFAVAGQFRYYLPRFGDWQVWGGSTVGGVVVNDSWTTKADREPYADTDFVGPRALTIGSEGLAVGLGVGFEWSFAEDWIFGSSAAYANWFLPGEPRTSPTGDHASLAGRIDILDFGLQVAYRIPI